MLAPSHYTLSYHVGSEPAVATNLVVRIANALSDTKVIAIAGYSLLSPGTRLPKNLVIVPLYNGKPSFGDVRKLRFYFDLYLAARHLVGKVDVVHHVLPFGYRETFNLLYRVAKSHGSPFIIGPVQSPQLVKGNDEYVGEKFNARKPLSEKLRFHRVAAKPVLERLFRATLESAEVVIAATRFAKNLYEEYVDPDKIVVIPFGIEARDIPPKPNYETNRLRIVYVGQLTLRKGILLALNALRGVLRYFDNVEFHVYGDGPLRAALLRFSEKYGILSKVHLHGFVERRRLLSKLREHDIYVHTSFSESFGLSLVESMAAGLPVVAQNIPNVNEIVVHGSTGFLFPIGDLEALRDYVEKLLVDSKLRAKLGSAARRRVFETYDWSVVTRRYIEIYTRFA